MSTCNESSCVKVSSSLYLVASKRESAKHLFLRAGYSPELYCYLISLLGNSFSSNWLTLSKTNILVCSYWKNTCVMAEPLTFHKKRRSVVKASLTKLSTKLTELEADTTNPTLLEAAKNLADKLKSLQQDFKNHQLSIIDRTEEEEALAEEQLALDTGEDQVSELSIRIQRLITLATGSKSQDAVRVANKQLALLQTKLESIDTAAQDIDGAEEDVTCTLEEYRDQVTEVKTELATLKTSLLTSDATTSDPIMQDHSRVEKLAFDCLLKIKKRLRTVATPSTKVNEATATKLPKLELPTFHGDILRWKNFWEQFWCMIDWTFPRKRSWCTYRMPSRTRQQRTWLQASRSQVTTMMKQSRFSRRDMIVYGRSIRCMFVALLKPLLWRMAPVKR